MTSQDLFDDIHSFCIQNSNDEIVKKYSRYFKDYQAFGVPPSLIEPKANELLKDKSVNLDLILEAAPLLIQTGKYEETILIELLVKKLKKQLSKDTFISIGKWFDVGINNWAHTDYLCGEIMKEFLLKDIINFRDLAEWRFAANPFQRRAVPVSLIKLAKVRKEFKEYFDFIDPMMNEKVREVHQGLGWFLRECWKIEHDITEEFLLKWKETSARLIFQYATEKMTKEEKLRFKRSK